MRRHLSIEPDPFPRSYETWSSPFAIHAAGRTDRGLERIHNEDRAAFGDLRRAMAALEPPATAWSGPGACFVGLVCDGMGGEAGGEIASRIAVETIFPSLTQACRGGEIGTGDIPHELVASIEAASARIREHAHREPVYARMGTTATLGAIVERAFVCAQVGDSRAYLFRHDVLAQITRDQTLVELLRRNGDIAPDGIGPNIILQAVGSSPRLEVVLTHTPVEAGDVLLLCSDGLTGVVDDDVIASTLASEPDPARACERLVTHTLEGGAPDNVTCLVLRIS